MRITINHGTYVQRSGKALYLGLTDVNLAHAHAVYTGLFFLPPGWGIQKEPGDEAMVYHAQF